MLGQYEVQVWQPPSATPPYLNLQGVVDPSLFKWSIRYAIRANQKSSFTATMQADDPRAAWFVKNAIVVIRRKWPGQDWRVENAFVVLYINPVESDSSSKLSIGGPDLYWFAEKAQVVPLATDTDGYSRKNDLCDVVMKNYTREQIGIGATLERQCPYLNVVAYLPAASGGGQVSAAATYGDSLLSVLQDLVPRGGLDFWFDWSPPSVRFVTGMYGTDRTVISNPGGPYVLFEKARGNLRNTERMDDYRDAASVAYVAGAGKGADREVEMYPAAGLAWGDLNQWLDRVEMTTNASRAEGGDTTALQTAGAAALYEKRPVTETRFEAIQTPSCRYGEHYFAGDYVTVDTEGIRSDYRVSIEIYLSGQGETIEVTFDPR